MTNQKIKTLRPTYAEIDLLAFGHNLEVAKELSGGDVIAVVKANAYGHGDFELSKYVYDNHGQRLFAVATIQEGVTLRGRLGDDCTIFILGYVDELHFKDVVENDLILTIFDYEMAERYDSFLSSSAKVSIKVDTGMNRLGFDTSLKISDFSENFPRLDVVHVMSHLSSADSDVDYTNEQIRSFKEFIDKNEIDCYTSLFNSAGICGYENFFTFARPGIMLYGYIYGENDVKLKKVMRIFSKIAQVKKVKKGEAVSYNRRFFAEKDMTIGVIPMGYADGYPRCFTNISHMYVDGVRCPVLGTVCMDMTMIDLTGVDLKGELKVEVMGDNVDAAQWAEWAETISYEVLCGISSRIPRIYVGQASD